MKFSVIIVNRNHCASLKRSLTAIIESGINSDAEIIVADNASTDKSLEMLAVNFPRIQVIVNEKHENLSKAANLAIRASSGEYIVLITPAIIFANERLGKPASFMDEHLDVAGLNIRMLTPDGCFIPESTFGLMKSWAAFLRLVGFNKYLPKTRFHDRQPSDWAEEFRIAEIDILNSDCMLVRRSALNEVGLFDERFGMSGFNIDLSYRLKLAGYKNYYFPKIYLINSQSGNPSKITWTHLKNHYGGMFQFALKYLVRLPEIHIPPIARFLPSFNGVK